jgi:hypothetical protein
MGSKVQVFDQDILIALFFHFPENAALETLEQVMMQALTMASTDRSAVVAVCLSVSGVNHPSDQQKMLDWIRYSSLYTFLKMHHPKELLYIISIATT